MKLDMQTTVLIGLLMVSGLTLMDQVTSQMVDNDPPSPMNLALMMRDSEKR